MELSLIVPPTVKEFEALTGLLSGRFCLANVEDEKYRKYFEYTPQHNLILDNGVFEESLVSNIGLLKLSQQLRAQVLVIPDLIGGTVENNQKHAIRFILDRKEFLDKARETDDGCWDDAADLMFVPQCERGDINGFWNTLDWAIDNADIGWIGICRDAVRNAFHNITHTDDQEINRLYFAILLQHNDILSKAQEKRKKWHFLGIGDNYHLIEHYWFVDSMDTASAFWQGYNGVRAENGRLISDLKRPKDYFTRSYFDLVTRRHGSDGKYCIRDIIEQNCKELQRYADKATKLRRQIEGGRI